MSLFVLNACTKFLVIRVRLVGGVEKWKDEKLVGGWKSGKTEKIWFSLMCVWLEGWKIFLFGWREKEEGEKCNLYKLTIMFFLYNSGKVRGVGECNKVKVFL